MQHFDDYQTFTDTTLVIPAEEANNIGYSTLGLIGEIGEYSEKIHKLITNTARMSNQDWKHIPPPAQPKDSANKTTSELLNILNEVIITCARAEKLKKEIRDGDKKLSKITIFSADERDEVEKELGDLLWYCSRAASSLKLKFSHVISINVKKLIRRIQKGVLHGSGDNR